MRFQEGLRDYLAGHGSVAEGFGLVWERTLEKVPLEDGLQGPLYRELLNWARCAELFTGFSARSRSRRSGARVA